MSCARSTISKLGTFTFRIMPKQTTVSLFRIVVACPKGRATGTSPVLTLNVH